jgi:hypothetical protein
MYFLLVTSLLSQFCRPREHLSFLVCLWKTTYHYILVKILHCCNTFPISLFLISATQGISHKSCLESFSFLTQWIKFPLWILNFTLSKFNIFQQRLTCIIILPLHVSSSTHLTCNQVSVHIFLKQSLIYVSETEPLTDAIKLVEP